MSAAFERWDGKKIDVSAIHCPQCSNYFWAALTEIEMPSFCPYCGLKFTGATEISNGDANDLQTGIE